MYRLLVLSSLGLFGCTSRAAIGDSLPRDDTAPADDSDPADDTADTGRPWDARELPVLLIHGVNGEAANWDTVVARLVADGWPADQVYAYTFEDPSWGCNVDNAETIRGWVEAILTETGQPRVNLVAHSMGTLSSRTYVKNLGGVDHVNTYVTLGGMHHGLTSSCSPDFPFKPCIWDEICATGELVTQLNEPPATPGPLHWISIYGTADEDIPNSSSLLDGAENIEMPGVEHFGPNGLQEDLATYQQLVRVLQYDRVY